MQVFLLPIITCFLENSAYIELVLFYSCFSMSTQQHSFYRIFKDEGVRFGWKHAKKDFFFFLQVFVLLGIANSLPSLVNWFTGRPQDAHNIGTFIAGILSLIFGFGLIKLFLHFVHERVVDIKDLWNHDRARLGWWLVAKVLHAVLVMIGMMLVVIPGIYVAARLYLFEYFVVDQDMDSIEAISASWEVTQ